MKKLWVISLVVIIMLSITACNNRNEINNEAKNLKIVKSYLNKEYTEKFKDPELIKDVKNRDVSHGLDGAVFWTEKGKGHTNYYKVYSIENDIEFEVVYNTDKRGVGDQLWDTYTNNMQVRSGALDIYSKVEEKFGDIVEYYFTEDSHKIDAYEIDTYQDIMNKLSRLKTVDYELGKSIGSASYVTLIAKINKPVLEFCKENYDDIIEINDFLIETNGNIESHSLIGLTVVTSNNVRLEFDAVGSKVRLYDRYEGDKVWGEELEEFIKRDSY